MVTLAEGPPKEASLRALHDRLESAYFGLARASSRWFERRTDSALMGGFAGLDSATMNRVALLDSRDDRALDATLADAGRFFGDHGVPWSVQLTPFSRPVAAEEILEARGFSLALELTVMTLSPLAEPPRAKEVAEVREARADEMPLFTALTVDAFRMPARYYAPLLDVNEAWVREGARAFLAFADGEAIATALLAPATDVTGIYNVATLRAWRRRGVARLLMRHLMREHAATGRRWLTLQVASGSPAETFYRLLGFEKRYAWRLFAR